MLPGIRSRVRNDIGCTLVELKFHSRKEAGSHKFLRFNPRSRDIHQSWQVISLPRLCGFSLVSG